MSEFTISYMLGSVLFIKTGPLLMPLHFSNSVTLVSCGNIECYMVILVSVGIDLGSDVHGPASSCGPGQARPN